MLNLKDQKYFSEKSLFTYDSVLTIGLQIYFDIPEMADEENYQDMFFTIKNTSNFKPGVKFDLQKDSSLIKPLYTLTGAWRFEPANSYFGYIKVLSNTRSEISLYLDFTVEGQKKYIYKGQRTFTKVKHFPTF
jgi:hypothetical protein